MLTVCLVIRRYPFDDNQEVAPIDWQEFIRDLAATILKEQSPRILLETRGKLYELTVHCIPATDILKVNSLVLSSPCFVVSL